MAYADIMAKVRQKLAAGHWILERLYPVGGPKEYAIWVAFIGPFQAHATSRVYTHTEWAAEIGTSKSGMYLWTRS